MADVLSAIDKWRGTATAAEASAAVLRAAGRAGRDAESVAISDGGEGFLDAFGGPNRSARITSSTGRPVDARWRLDGRTAYLEMASADGLALAGGPEANDALNSGTRGTGELIATAVAAGSRRIVVGLGGSAGTDGGLGCVELLAPDHRLSLVELVGACDVMLPFRSALDFAAQKGASPAEIRMMASRLERVAQIYEQDLGVDVRDLPGAGAAGGLGGGLAALGAQLLSGFEVVAEACELAERVAEARLVITGEGWLDEHSFDGKAVGGVLHLAREAGVDTLVVVGGADPEGLARAEGLGHRVVSLVEMYGPERARSHTLDCIEAAVLAAISR